jgi:hypothetical protein
MSKDGLDDCDGSELLFTLVDTMRYKACVIPAHCALLLMKGKISLIAMMVDKI